MISPDDLLVFQRAVKELDKANGILQFLSNHFKDKYKLQAGDYITPDGQIVSSQPSMFDNWSTNESEGFNRRAVETDRNQLSTTNGNGPSLDGAETIPLINGKS